MLPSRIPRAVKRVDALALVDGALAPGDCVVVEGVQRLSPGRAVQIAPVPAAPGAASAAR